MHMQTRGKKDLVQPRIGLYFTDKPRSKFPMLVELERDASIDIPAGDRDYVMVSILGFGDAAVVSAAAERIARVALGRM